MPMSDGTGRGTTAPRRYFLPIAILAIVLVALFIQRQEMPVYPVPEWVEAPSLQTLGYSKAGLAEVDAYIDTLNTHSIQVSVGGEVIYARGDLTEVSYVASVRKSVLAMMYGRYVLDGTIDLNSTLEELGVDDIGGLLPIEKQATIEDLISARSGIYHPASNSGDNTADAPPRGSQKPGSYYLYNNWDFNAAGGIFEMLTGRGIYQELNDTIAIPLGFQDFNLGDHEKSGDAERSRFLAYHMHFSTRDLARIGYLMLRNGRWLDAQLIDPGWVLRMVSPHTQAPEMNPDSRRNTGFDYGYMWWVLDDDTLPPVYAGAYAGRGHFGQYLAVIPELDMVVSHKTWPVDYETPEEYEDIRVTWPQFMGILDRLAAARE